MGKLAFLLLQFEDAFLNGVFGYDLVHVHILRLSDAVRTIGGLVLRGRVPPRVGVHHYGRTHKVQPRIARFERDEEHGNIVAIEFVHQFHTAFLRCLAGDGVEVHALFSQTCTNQVKE